MTENEVLKKNIQLLNGRIGTLKQQISEKDHHIQMLNEHILQKEDHIQRLDKYWMHETKRRHSLKKIADLYREILEGEEERTEKYLQRIRFIMNIGYPGLIPSFPDELRFLLKKCDLIDQNIKRMKLNGKCPVETGAMEDPFYSIYNLIKKKEQFELKVHDYVQYVNDFGVVARGKVCQILAPTLLVEDNDNSKKIIPLNSLIHHHKEGFLKNDTLQIGQEKFKLLSLLEVEVEHQKKLQSQNMSFDDFCIP